MLPEHAVIACYHNVAKLMQPGHARVGAPLPWDQQIHSAKAFALLVALRAADSVSVSFNILSDCLLVLQKAWRVRAGGALPRFV